MSSRRPPDRRAPGPPYSICCTAWLEGRHEDYPRQIGFTDRFRGKRLVTVCAELGSPNEFMTITVAVPNNGEDGDIRACGIARAKDFARQFCDVSPLSFRPTTVGMDVALIDAMPLSPEQEALCERLEKGESTPAAATLIGQQAQEIDRLWDRLSRAYALVRRESPSEMIEEEMEALLAMLEERRGGPDNLRWFGRSP